MFQMRSKNINYLVRILVQETRSIHDSVNFGLHLLCMKPEVVMIPRTFQKSNAFLMNTVNNTLFVTDCGGKPADVYFVIDSSSSILEQDFKKMLQFVSDFVDVFDIGPTKTRIGVVLFSDGIHPIIHISNDFSRSELKKRIMEAKLLQGATRTGSVIKYLREYGFSKQYARASVAHVAILLTDGQSTDTHLTVSEAKLAQREGIYLYAVGIGDQIDRHELEMIASQPEDEFVFEIDNFNMLSSVLNILAIKTCNGKFGVCLSMMVRCSHH